MHVEKSCYFCTAEFYLRPFVSYIQADEKQDGHRAYDPHGKARRGGFRRVDGASPHPSATHGLRPAARPCGGRRRGAGDLHPPLDPRTTLQPHPYCRHMALHHLLSPLLRRVAPSPPPAHRIATSGTHGTGRRYGSHRVGRVAATCRRLAATQTAHRLPTARGGRTQCRRDRRCHGAKPRAGKGQPMGRPQHRKRKTKTIWNTLR